MAPQIGVVRFNGINIEYPSKSALKYILPFFAQTGILPGYWKRTAARLILMYIRKEKPGFAAYKARCDKLIRIVGGRRKARQRARP